jgi:fructokinase
MIGLGLEVKSTVSVNLMEVFGGIEAGGTKFLCGVGTGPADLHVTSFPTSSPDTTVSRAAQYIRESAGTSLKAVGIGSFGPLDLDPKSETYGHITSTPKRLWQNYDFAGEVERMLNVPVAFDTDVNAAALAEASWGAAHDVDDFIYLTVGTGIGGGAVVNGQLVHGLMHPEMGHIRLPHDWTKDPFAGNCPYHNDCLEGLASGSAIRERWGEPGHDLPPDHSAWILETHYLALALATWVCTLSPKRIIIGGGVMQRDFLFPAIRRELKELLNDYIPKLPLIEDLDKFIVPPKLGNQSGVLGAILLAKKLYSKPYTS